MLRLLRTSTFCLWCFLLLHKQAVADEEAFWGPTPPREKPPEEKQTSSWWPKLPSLPSFPFQIPFIGGSDTDNEASALTTTATELTKPVVHLQDYSQEGRNFEVSEPTSTSTQELLTSVTTTGPESLSTGTSDSPQGSTAQSHNDSLVSDSYSPTSSFTRNTLFTNNPASASTSEQNATHNHPQQGTTQAAGPGEGASPPHLQEDSTEEAEDFIEKIYSTVVPETTVPTALTWAAAQTTTTVPGLMETTGSSKHTVRPVMTSGETAFVRQTQHSTVSMFLHTEEDSLKEIHSSEPNLGFSESRLEEELGVITTAMGLDGQPVSESITSTTQSQKVNFPIAGELPGKDVKEAEEDVAPSADGSPDAGLADVSTPPSKPLTPSLPHRKGIRPESPHIRPYIEDWMPSPPDSDITYLPDCNKHHSRICNFSDTWDATTSSDTKPTPNTTALNQSINPYLIQAPLMLVPLYTDWNSAMAAWGLAWEAHVYGAGCTFVMLTLASALNLLCLPLRCPSGCGYFALVSLFLLAAGCTRSFLLLYDAYGHQDLLPSTEASLMLNEAPFPCLTAAFGLVFLLLSMRSRMQLSYSAFQRPCFLACLVFIHFAAAFGPVTLLKFYLQKPRLCLFLSLISRGAFVALATFLSAAYFVFYIYVRADSKHIYHLNNTSPTPAERYNRCPFAESRDWNRAAITVCLSALFFLACAGLQLYAILNAMGVAGGEEVFHPWPWWAFQFSCRLCELGVCLTLALVVAQPIYCSDHLPAAGSCWTELLASKSPMLPGSYQWSLSQQEKLAIVDTAGLGETESLPLYTLMDERLGSSLNGLDLLYHSNRALAYRDLDLDLDLQGLEKHRDGGGEEPSGASSFTSDSTTDLRPPSPINLRRSIDEALFSESLFPISLFSPAKPIRCSDLSVNNQCALPGNGLCDPLSGDSGLYRTSSCMEMVSKPAQTQGDTVVSAPLSPSLSTSSSCSSPEQWRGSSSSCSLYRASLGGSSMVLCLSPERQGGHLIQQGSNTATFDQADPQRHYHTLGAASQESLDLDISSEAERSVQEEFITVCRQIDALSICSETIDL
ncbi:proline-rich transmembrane protein 4 isoform X2 [Antennarius striatus]|uniref:proline-rich transmembrane protein 4 isoform X2 n=1 Tax=Antennarius striatus TaxID=241820 RepID=UPI0035B43DEA